MCRGNLTSTNDVYGLTSTSDVFGWQTEWGLDLTNNIYEFSLDTRPIKGHSMSFDSRIFANTHYSYDLCHILWTIDDISVASGNRTMHSKQISRGALAVH